jgi:hypothetical protein
VIEHPEHDHGAGLAVVSGPAAEAGAEPRGEGEGSLAKWVPLARGLRPSSSLADIFREGEPDQTDRPCAAAEPQVLISRIALQRIADSHDRGG